MTDADLRKKLDRLALKRGADAWLAYLTSDKEPAPIFGASVASDVLPFVYQHLQKMGRQQKLLLFLNTNGGSIDTPWPLVSQLREYCDELEVVIPNKALSAGTLISLGCDTILMTPNSFLSPIDPRGVFIINQQQKDIQVEDIYGYVDFVKSKIGASDQQTLSMALQLLSNEVPPSMLGGIYRTHFLIRSLANKMLSIHKNSVDKNQAELIVGHLTEKLFSHNHMIGRVEAKAEIGFKDIIVYADASDTKLIDGIHNGFVKNMKSQEIFNPLSIIGDRTDPVSFTLEQAVLLSPAESHAFQSKFTISLNPPGTPQPVNINTEPMGWLKKGE